ncbi:MAG: Smr/MutS family protein [Alphaproteobacteria bacterium]
MTGKKKHNDDSELFGNTDLWDKVAESIKPLKNKKNRHGNVQNITQQSNKKPWEQSSGLAPLGLTAFGEKTHKDPQIQNRELTIGDLTQMDGRNADRLRKGHLNFDGRIDLHGFTAEQAWNALRNFILASANMNRRCVLIITGKGWKSENGIGVLRSNVPKWLNSPELHPYILGFSRAQDRDGGDGAFYVMLRRNRNKR